MSNDVSHIDVMMACLQETGDGELVVLHDLHSVLAASQDFEVNKDIMSELARAGLQPEAPAKSTMVSARQKLFLMPCLACRDHLDTIRHDAQVMFSQLSLFSHLWWLMQIL